MKILTQFILLPGLVFLITLSTGCGSEDNDREEVTDLLTGKKILMVIAPGKFRDEELLIPREIFEWQGAEVTLTATAGGEFKGMFGALAEVELPLSEIKPADYDAVIFVGGSGAQQYWDDPAVHTVAREFQKESKIIGAICIAPVILERAGLLEGRKVAVFHSAAPEIKTGRVTTERIEVDGNIVTGNGPDSAEDFAGAVVNLLKK
ncbi:MAG TPA: DJ-1/PfpI family protein [Firmicutes bacterium]|nr:DJ-1/PfpI family protein [Bacillota bacterium]